MTKILFILLAIIHYLGWFFVLFSFLNIKTAYINFFIVIPIIYILHIFPFHIIIEAKKQVIPDKIERETELDNIDKSFIIPYYIVKLQKMLDEKCFCSPLSPQGMLILGLLSSGYVLIKNINIIKNINMLK